MTMRVGAALCLIAVVCTTVGADRTKLTTLNMPHYGGLARQARVQGIIKVAFTLTPNAAGLRTWNSCLGLHCRRDDEQTLNESAVENVNMEI